MTVRLCICQSDECSRNDRQTVEVSDDCSKSVRLWRWGCIAAAACGLVWVTGTTRHPAPGTSGLSADPDSQRPKLSDIPTRSGEDKKGPKLLLRHRNQTWTNCGQSNLQSTGCYGTYWTWTNQFNLLDIFGGCLWQYCLSFEIFLILSNLQISNSVRTIGFWVNCCVLIGTHRWMRATRLLGKKYSLTSRSVHANQSVEITIDFELMFSYSWEMSKLEIINQSKRLRGPSQIWSILDLNQI